MNERTRRLPGALVMPVLALLGTAAPTIAQPRTMGSLLNAPSASPGYTLFEAYRYPETFLIDNHGRLVHSWPNEYEVRAMSYLLENGHLLRGCDPGTGTSFPAGGAAGLVREIDWDGNIRWEFSYFDEQHRTHHDIAPLPNGNVLAIAWEHKSPDEAITAGRDPAFLGDELWPDHVIEIAPVGTGGEIVWEWHAWDHLIQDFDATKENFGVVADHPELIDVNYPEISSPDWLHFNAIDYNAELDQIVMSCPRFGEFWIIDHSTTTTEAASHAGGTQGMGGDLLYRWGNPASYGRGTSEDQKLFFQHDTHWIPPGRPGAGDILILNNGTGRPDGAYSSIEEVVTPVSVTGGYPVPPSGVPHGPAEAVWTYVADPPEDFWASFVSGVQRQPNGNTLICSGPDGRFFELDPNEDIVWEYVNPVNSGGPQVQGSPPVGNLTFRAVRYSPSYHVFWYQHLEPGAPIERYPTSVALAEPEPARFTLAPAFPNPFRPRTTISFTLRDAGAVSLDVHDVTGRHVVNLVATTLAAGRGWRAASTTAHSGWGRRPRPARWTW